ncbi:MAG TPA: TIGR02281 family clan AA aspartic protease [Xanthobacteraceae bacterium]|nr:TIGR02281 family clan AA aspartic protease [Xanthobacteraceae bacterium]
MRSEKLLWLVILGLCAAVGVLIYRHDEGSVASLDANSFASLVYLLALLVLVGGGAYGMFYGGFQESLRSLARTAALWIAIIGFFALMYVYRADLGRAFDSVFSAQDPIAREIVTGSINRMIRVERDTNGEFNVRVNINNAPVKMLVDTGASSVVLTVEAARAAGLPVDLLKYDVTIDTAKGRSFAAAVVLDEIRIGNIIERRVPALIARPGQLRTSLLGMSFLMRLESFEVRGQQLVLNGRR